MNVIDISKSARKSAQSHEPSTSLIHQPQTPPQTSSNPPQPPPPLCLPQLPPLPPLLTPLLPSPTRFKAHPKFQQNLTPTITDTNFQSMTVQLHYGNLLLEIVILFTHFQQKLFQNSEICGAFGEIRFCQVQGQVYAVKGVKVKGKGKVRGMGIGIDKGMRMGGIGDMDIDGVYREYFLGCLAEELGVGPKMLRLFGYDLVVSKRTVFFSMQKCTPINPNPNLPTTLSQNLQILHSKNFLHLDIKPQNIAYSPSLQKPIFLDYGLSRLIIEKPGQKTNTNFCGTLNYCSTEMKKCWILGQMMPVDLYANDWWGLGRAVEKLGVRGIEGEEEGAIRGVRGLGGTEMGLIGDMERQMQVEEVEEEDAVLGPLIYMIRLKYHLQNQNLPKILTHLQSPHPLKPPKSIYQTLLTAPKQLLQNPQIKHHLQLLIKQIQQLQNLKSDQSSSTDNILCRVFCEDSVEMCAGRIMGGVGGVMGGVGGWGVDRGWGNWGDFGIGVGIGLRSGSVERMEFFCKMFLCIDPFTKKNVSTLSSRQLKTSIITKIAQKNPNPISPNPISPNPISPNPTPTLFCQKLRSTLLFFHTQLSPLKNLKIMQSLRLLFISIQEWGYLQKIQDEILEIIQSQSQSQSQSYRPVLKILKIMEFSLFWDSLLQDFQHWRKGIWRGVVERVGVGDGDGVGLAVKAISKHLMVQNNYYTYDNNYKTSILHNIIKLSNMLTDPDQKQSIQAIKYIYLQISKIHFPLPTPPKGLTLKIYSRMFILFNVQLDQGEQLDWELLVPLRLEFQREWRLGPSKALALTAIAHQFQILKEAKASTIFVNPFFFKSLEPVFVYKQCIYFFVSQVRQFIESHASSPTPYSLFTQLLLLHSLLPPITLNHNQAPHPQKLLQAETTAILAQIQQILERVICGEQAQGILKGEKGRELGIQVGVIRAQVGICGGLGQDVVRGMVQGVFGMLDPLPFRSPNFVIYFATLFQHFYARWVSQSPHYSKQILIKLTESYLKTNNFFIFQKMKALLGFYIKTKNQALISTLPTPPSPPPNIPTLDTILQFINHFQQGKQYFVEGFYNTAFIFAVGLFCESLGGVGGLGGLGSGLLEVVYGRIGVGKMEEGKEGKGKGESQCGLYGYFVFQVFLGVWDRVDEGTRRKQIIRTTLCLDKMSPICKRKILPDLLKLSRTFKIYTAQRKSLICSRLQGKLPQKLSSKQSKLPTKPPQDQHQPTHTLIDKVPQSIMKKIFSRIKKYNSETREKLKFELRLDI